MEREKLQAWRDWVRAELESCVSFWLEHGMDKEHGGVYTCLTRDGKVFSTDKSVWMQVRCALRCKTILAFRLQRWAW